MTAASGVDPRRRVAAHGSLYLASRALQLGAYVLVVPVITRVLGASQYGTVALALSVHQLLAAIAPLGLTSVVAWAIYEKRPGALDSSRQLLAATALIALSVCVVASITAPWWGTWLEPGEAAVWQLATWTVLPLTVQTCSLSILQAQHRPFAFSASSITTVLVGQGLGLLFVGFSPAAASYLTGVLVGTVVGAVVALLQVGPRRVGLPSRAEIRASVRHGGPSVPHLLSFVILTVGDRILVERFLGLDQAARYQSAYVVAAIGLTALGAANSAWAPAIYGADDRDRWRLLADSTSQFLWLSFAAVATISLTSPIVLRIFMPPSFEPETLKAMVAIVSVCMLPMVVYLSGVHVLFQQKRTAGLMVIMPVAAAVNVAANLVLIPVLGLDGAALATLAGYLATAVGARLFARRCVRVAWPDRTLATVGVLSAGVVLVSVALPDAPGATAFRVAGAVMIASAVLATQVRQLRRPRRELA